MHTCNICTSMPNMLVDFIWRVEISKHGSSWKKGYTPHELPRRTACWIIQSCPKMQAKCEIQWLYASDLCDLTICKSEVVLIGLYHTLSMFHGVNLLAHQRFQIQTVMVMVRDTMGYSVWQRILQPREISGTLFEYGMSMPLACILKRLSGSRYLGSVLIAPAEMGNRYGDRWLGLLLTLKNNQNMT